ncbi:MAG TPA: DHA2 family efflux MFS transporter permease subunit [Actinomycetes bacterium]
MVGQPRTDAVTRGAWPALAVVAGGQFLAVMSTTVVSVALPTIGEELRAGATDLQWIVDAYVLVYSSLLVAGGVLGDRHGRKGVYLLGVAAFGLGSLLTGLAPSVGPLLLGRVVQGLGPALLVPGSLTIIRAIFEDPGQRAAAIGLWSTGSGLALAVGPGLGGVVVDTLGWRWVFLLNVPLSAVLILLAARYVPRLPRTPARGRFDWLGAVLTTAGVAALAFAIIDGQDHGWGSWPILAAFAGGVAALVAFVAWERRLAEPLVDVSLFLRPVFTAANVAALVVFFSFVGAVVYFSAYLQQVQGHSPVVAGLDVSAIGIAFALAAPLSGRLVGRVGPRLPMLAGLATSGVATLGLLRLGPDTGIGSIWWNFALVGAGVGLCLTPMTAIAVAAVDASRAGMASAVHNAMRQLGQVLGVAVLGALVYAHLPPGSVAGRRLDPRQGLRFVDGLHHALWVSGLALLAAALLAALLLPRRSPAAAPVLEP